MNILDFSTTHTQETDEIINVSDSNPIHLAHDIFYNKDGKLVTIFTGSGEGGDELSEGSDFDVGGVFPDGSLPESISPDEAYTTIEITNDEYHDTDLYVNYYPIGDVISAARWNTSTLPGQVDEVSSNTTITERTALRIVHVTTGATDRTITLPAGSDMEAGDEIEVYKVDDGSGKVTISRAGSDTIDGVTSVDIDSQYDMARVRWTGSFWTLVEYKDHGSNSDGEWVRCADGTMIQRGTVSFTDGGIGSSSADGWRLSTEAERHNQAAVFPVDFIDADYSETVTMDGNALITRGILYGTDNREISGFDVVLATLASESSVLNLSGTYYWTAEGRWRA